MRPIRELTSPLCRGIPNFDFNGDSKWAIGCISMAQRYEEMTKNAKKLPISFCFSFFCSIFAEQIINYSNSYEQ